MTRALWLLPEPGGTGRNNLLTLALSGSASCVLLQDRDWGYQLIANLPDCWQAGLAGEKNDHVIFGDEIAGKLDELKRNIATTGTERSLEIAVDEQVFVFTIGRIGDPGGDYFYQTRIDDVTLIRNMEHKLTSLQREGRHRSKNMLAVIQSIASQTAKHAASVPEFIKKFRDRVHSLSQSQDLITESRWQGAQVFDIVHQQTKRLTADERRLISMQGDNVLLSPNVALHIGLALHELLANAVNHGTVFMKRDAPIVIWCRRTQLKGREAIRFLWQEPFDAPMKAGLDRQGSYTKHFGSTVLEHVVPASVNGEASYELGGEQITYSVTFPLQQSG